MSTPNYIRVAGQLYRLRDDVKLSFIKFDGWLYKLAKTSEQNVAAIDALTKLANFANKLSGSIKDQKIAGLLKQAYGELGVLATKLAKGDYEEKSAALESWADLKSGLSDFSAQLQKANLPKLSTAVKGLLDAADKAVVDLKSAEGLGAKFETKTAPAGVPSKQGPTVDWGEHAPKKPQQQLQASFIPQPIVVNGALYKPLIQITADAIEWAKSTEPEIVEEHSKFDPMVVHLLSSGA